MPRTEKEKRDRNAAPVSINAAAAGWSPPPPLLETARRSVRAHDKDINCVAVSPNDALVASASQDKTVRLWRARNLEPAGVLKGHKRGVWKVREICFVSFCSISNTVFDVCHAWATLQVVLVYNNECVVCFVFKPWGRWSQRESRRHPQLQKRKFPRLLT